MSNLDYIPDEDILTAWHLYMAEQPGFVGAELRLLRERQGITLQDQQEAFGANDSIFLRLQAMSLPRANQFVSDSHRIAEHCGLRNPFAFVQAMLIARNLHQSSMNQPVEQVYQAAFDAIDDLDALPDEE